MHNRLNNRSLIVDVQKQALEAEAARERVRRDVMVKRMNRFAFV